MAGGLYPVLDRKYPLLASKLVVVEHFPTRNVLLPTLIALILKDSQIFLQIRRRTFWTFVLDASEDRKRDGIQCACSKKIRAWARSTAELYLAVLFTKLNFIISKGREAPTLKF